ncbi:MAG: hypothetical protein JSV89_15400 [Spirochaetaceae bacterium]|nr:MAG: hypothetical protein JSV89_15400 [Spirochaetaceae bacterium]
MFRILAIYGVAFIINYVWEMLQMPFYERMSFADPASYLQCVQASFGDANIIIAIFGLGLFMFRNWEWPKPLTLWKLAYLAVIGGSIAVSIELFALKAGKWRYSSLMPLLPLVRVGLIPFLQLLILPYLSYSIAGRFFRVKNVPKNDT